MSAGAGIGVTPPAVPALSYTPDTNFAGTDNFEIKVSDGAASNTLAVTMDVTNVNDAPSFDEGGSTSITLDEDTTQSINSALSATDVDDNQTLTWSVASAPANGSLGGFSPNPTQSSGTSDASQTPSGLSYTPNADYNGSDSFEIKVADGNGGTDTITVNATVDPVNDAPSFSVAGNKTVGEGLSRIFGGFVTSTDMGPNEGGQSVSDYNVTVASDPDNVISSVDIANNGELSVTTNTGNMGTASIEAKLVDNGGTGNGGDDTSATKSFDITVNNAPPVANDDTGLSMNEDTSQSFDVVSNDTDPNDSQSDLSIKSGSLSVSPSGSASIAGPDNHQIDYTPAADFYGAVDIDYKIEDDQGATSDTATANITVDPVNDAPGFSIAGNKSLTAGTTKTFGGFVTSTDMGPNEGGQSVSDYNVTVASDPGNIISSVDIANNGDLTVTANSTTGTATIDAQLIDDGGTSNGGEDTSNIKSFDVDICASTGGSMQGGVCAESRCCPGGNDLIAAASDEGGASATYTWGGLGSDDNGNAGSTTDGYANTEWLANSSPDTHPAANACWSKTTNGYSDWYLPATEELDTLYQNNASIGNFDTSGNHPDSFYWTSFEFSINYVPVQRFSNGDELSNYTKDQDGAVRCVRRSN